MLNNVSKVDAMTDTADSTRNRAGCSISVNSTASPAFNSPDDGCSKTVPLQLCYDHASPNQLQP